MVLNQQNKIAYNTLTSYVQCSLAGGGGIGEAVDILSHYTILIHVFNKTFTIILVEMCVCVLCFYGRFLFGFVFVSSADRLFSTNISKYFDDNAISLFSGIVLFCACVCVWFGSLKSCPKKQATIKCVSLITLFTISHTVPSYKWYCEHTVAFSSPLELTQMKWESRKRPAVAPKIVEYTFFGRISFYKWSFDTPPTTPHKERLASISECDMRACFQKSIWPKKIMNLINTEYKVKWQQSKRLYGNTIVENTTHAVLVATVF